MLIPLITSRQNPRVKRAARLRDRRQRQKQGRILIDGLREIQHALNAGIEFDEVFVHDASLAKDDLRLLVETISQTGAETVRVTQEVFEKIAFGERGDGIVVVARPPTQSLATIHLPPKPIVAVLEGIEKPGNIGAIARSADASGLDAMVVADGRTDLYNPNAIRASLGLIFSLPVAEASAPNTLDWLRAQALPIYVARPDAERIYTDVDYSSGGALVLGNESNGVSTLWSGTSVEPIRLPMSGIADSLNVSVAAAILFYETLRQKSNDVLSEHQG